MLVDRLLEEVDRASLHRADARRHGAVAVTKMIGRKRRRAPERGLEVEPALARETDVEHEARGAVRDRLVAEGLGGGEGLDVEAGRRDQTRQRPAQRRIVVDHVDDPVRHHAAPVSGSPGRST